MRPCRAAPRRHRPRLQLVPAGGLHLGAAGRAAVVVEAHRRDLRVGAHRRGPGGLRRAAARADGARAGDDRAVRALLPRHGHARDARRSRPRRSARRPTATRSSRQAHKRTGLEIQVLSREEEARYGYLAAINSDDAERRRHARPRRRLDAARPGVRPARARRALVAAGRGDHDRALPGRGAGQGEEGQGAQGARAPTSSRRRRGSTARRARVAGWPASAARCATSPPPRSSRPGCRPTASRASR